MAGDLIVVKRYAVIGQPVGHSLSPRIHAAFAEAEGIALDYDRIEIAGDVLLARLAERHAEGWAGFNVTVPHKQAVLAACTSLSEAAERAGAVNTLVRTPTGWHGDNTDGPGLLRDLQRLGVTVAGRRVLVLGAGGAVRGILGPLLRAQPASLTVSNRNPWKPEALAEAFADLGTITPRTHWALKGDVFDLVINGMSAGHGGAMPALPAGLMVPGATAYDLSYGAAHEPFAVWASDQGAQTVHDGLGMLVEQAALSFQCWHDVVPDTAAVHAALRAAQG